mgnify:CR=1 FL=1
MEKWKRGKDHSRNCIKNGVKALKMHLLWSQIQRWGRRWIELHNIYPWRYHRQQPWLRYEWLQNESGINHWALSGLRIQIFLLPIRIQSKPLKRSSFFLFFFHGDLIKDIQYLRIGSNYWFAIICYCNVGSCQKYRIRVVKNSRI